MPKQNPLWIDEVIPVVHSLSDVFIDDESKFFDMRPRVAIRVKGLEGLGIIHRQGANGPFSLCVFEPSTSEESGFGEVFERDMLSLKELPKQIAAWKKFRSKDSLKEISDIAKKYSSVVLKAIREKQKVASCFERSTSVPLEQRFASVGIDVDFRSLGVGLPSETQSQLQQDIQSIVPELLAWHMPCDDTGRWLLKRRVPLFRYDRDKRRMLDACLVVVLPDKRSGRARMTTEWLSADTQSARLDGTTEYFDLRFLKDFDAKILGGQIAMPKVQSRKGQSKRKANVEADIIIDISKTLALQYEGKYSEACAMVGLEIDDSIHDCLEAKRVAHMCTCCAELDLQLVAWSECLKETLLSMNLATMVPLIVRDQSKRAAPRKDAIPIVPFPLQRHTKKANLSLDVRKLDKPRLTIDMTGSMNRVPISIWKRPVEFDAVARKLIDTAELPEIIRDQFC